MAIFPTAVATDSDLYVAVNATSTQLTDNPLTAGATTVNVVSTTGFPTVGFISIDNEIIKYTGTTATSFTGCTRGADGTSATSHVQNSQVFHNVIAAHHNVLKDEIIAIETFLNAKLGTTGGAYTINRALQTSGTGIIEVSTVTSTELGYVSGVTSAIQTQLNGKASDSLVVHLAGSESITGAKTFDSSTLLMKESGGGSDVITFAAAPLSTSRLYTFPDAGASADFVMTQGTQTISGIKTFDGQLIGKGTTTNDSAAAGYIGEEMSQTRLRSARVALTTTTAANVTASPLSLMAGDWEISGVVTFEAAGTTSVGERRCAINTTSATSPADDRISSPSNGVIANIDISPTATGKTHHTAVLTPCRVSLSGTTDYYLVAVSTFTVSTMEVYGTIHARRIR